MAFLLSEYIDLILALRRKGYELCPVYRYFQGFSSPCVFLRHDVDRLPTRAREMAISENSADIVSTYYFRCNRKAQFPENHIADIRALGHEIGYHYETVVRYRRQPAERGNAFRRELASLCKLARVYTAVAHGSPLSALSNVNGIDSRVMKELGLLGDPQLDFDFSAILYVTDTGGIFGSPANRRDWSNGMNLRSPKRPDQLPDILEPEVNPLVLLNTHPERWPASSLGLVQASTCDIAANLLKWIARYVDFSSSP